MVEESIGRIFNFDNNFLSKMAANMTAKSSQQPYLCSKTWYRKKFSVEYYVFIDQESIACIYKSNNIVFFMMAAKS